MLDEKYVSTNTSLNPTTQLTLNPHLNTANLNPHHTQLTLNPHHTHRTLNPHHTQLT